MSSFTALNNCVISSGVSRIRKKHHGGIDKIFLFPFRKLNRSSIYTEGVFLDSFPITEIYEFDVVSKSFQENTNINPSGVEWEQIVSFDIPITTPSSQVYKLVNNDYRCIILDNIGNYRILGLYNGLEADITNQTGTDKSSLNGYKIQFKGKETNQAYFLNNLDLFRITKETNYIFQDGCNFIFEDGTNFIFN